MSRLELELHPLQNYEILSTIFSFCSVNDLKNCRLVGAKLWPKASLNSWREKSVLRIRSNNDTSGVCFFNKDDKNYLEFVKFRTMCEEQEDIFMFRGKPFQRILLKDFAPERFGKDSEELTCILESYSDQLKHVTFKSCVFPTVKSFLDTIFLSLPNLVELKLDDNISFQINQHDIVSYPIHQNLKCVILDNFHKLQFPWKALFNNIANLEKLQIKSSYNKVTEEVMEVMRAVHGIRPRDDSKWGVRDLEISSYDNANNVETIPVDFAKVMPKPMIDADAMPLERFTGSMVDVVHMKPYSETLKSLSVFFTKKEVHEYRRKMDWEHGGWDSDGDSNVLTRTIEDDVSDISNEKISLPHLKEFHAQGRPFRVFRNLNKVEASNLETLLVENVPASAYNMRWSSRSGRIDKLNNPSFGNVTRFEIYCNRRINLTYQLDLEEVKSLSSCMPNMLHVKIPLTGEAFTELCRAWPKLITLTVVDCLSRDDKSVDDAAITGIPLQYQENPSTVGRLPNITNLENLTEFESPEKLSDLSINFGFLPLPRLQYLKAKFRQISKDAKAALQKRVPKLEISEP